jgi:geranylgeranyl pyrophosphate synthase
LPEESITTAVPPSNQPETIHLIKNCILELLELPALSPMYRQAILQVLSRDQSLFEEESASKSWSRGGLALAIFRSTIGASPDHEAARTQAAALLGAAVHMLYLAADVIDDVEDGDYPASELAMPLALNASTGLLLLAQYALLSIPGTVISAPKLTEVVRQFNLEMVRTCSGQHNDLQDSYVDGPMSEEQCLAIAAGKNSAMHGTYHALAASLATDNDELIDLFRKFGSKLGLALQLQNDISDILHPQTKHDLVDGKATLPLVYSLARDEYGPQLQQLLQDLNAHPEKELLDHAVELIWKAGGIFYTWVQSQLIGMEACDIIKKIEQYCQIDPYIYEIIQLYEVRDEELDTLLESSNPD